MSMIIQPKARLYLANETPVPAVVAAIEAAGESESVKVLAVKCYETAMELVSRSAYSHFVQSAAIEALENGGTVEERLAQKLAELNDQIKCFFADAEKAMQYIQLLDASSGEGMPS
jgi:hypothetical protein